MRAISSSREALWSRDTSTTLPSRHRTARESPTHATVTTHGCFGFPPPRINAHTAVEPVRRNFSTSCPPPPPPLVRNRDLEASPRETLLSASTICVAQL